MKKRILALICALAMSVTMVAPAQASALTGSAVADNTVENAVSDNTEEPVITETIVSDVNPVYKDVVSGLSTSEETEFSLYSEDETPPENCETDLNVVINAIREAMKAREESLYIEYQHDADLGEQFLTEWVRMAVAETGNPKEGDYLRFHYQHSDGLAKTWTYSSGIKKSKIDISFQYYSNAEQEAAVDAAIETLIGTLGINNAMSDYEKVKAVYDYMCENITYDYDNLNDDTYTLKYSAYAALINRTSVCQGYANLLYRLLNEVGVNARIISGIGNGGPHSWNIIKLGDYYYLADATWDAPRAEKGMEYEYFLKGSDNFTDHVCDEEYAGYEFAAEYPIAAEDYVYVPVEIVAEGSCGDNATWTLDVDGELRISGSGAITDNTEFGEYKDQIKTLVIEEGITEIGESVFNKYSGFTGSLELPDSLTSIGDMAFFCCSGFTGNLELPDNLTDLGESVFSQCSGLNGNLTLPENLKSIGNEAFRSCTGLKGNLELPEGLTSIGESAFYGCTGFTGDLELPDNLINIGISAFEGCTGFDGRLKLTQNLKTIESGVFMNCTGLNGELELPEGLTKVDMYAFTSCSGFDGNLELPESLVSVGYNAFGSTSFDKIIVRNASCDIEQSKPTLPQNAIINGYIDSTAHAYAKKFGRDFLCILHLWNENFTIDKESSCEEEGTKSIHCSVCDIVDESTREVISATGHTYATVLSNDTYNHWYECHCGVKKDVNSHEFEWLIDLEPTEEMTGLKHEECTVCDYKRNVGTVIEKLPHTHNIKYIEFKAQTCEEDGNKEHYFCTKCNKYYQDESGTIELVYDTILLPATGHTHSDIWSNDEDSHWYECHCGDKKAVEEHEFEWVVDKKATEEETGLKHEECVVCKYIRNKDTEIEKLSHTHDMKSVAAMKPTCEEDGNIEYFTCIKCNKNYKDEAGMIELTAEEIMLSATGHNHSEEWSKDEENHWHECICGDKKTVEEHEFEWVVDKKATEEETGLKHEECVVCKYIRNKDTEIEKLPHTHSMESVAAMKPTCEEDGNIEYFTCIKCNKNYKDEAGMTELTAEEIMLSAIGHSHSEEWSSDEENHWYECTCGDKKSVENHEFEWIVDKQATEEETGLKHEECTICKYSRNENTEIEKLPHTHSMESVAAMKPTCEEDGNIEYFTCIKCNKNYKDEAGMTELTAEEIILSATGHNHSEEWSSDEDNHWYECTCGDKKSVENHEFEWVVDKKATEEETGLKHEECTTCKYSRNENTEIAKLPQTQDLFEYEFKTSTTVKIIGIKEDAVIPEELIIPTEINGYKVTAIGEFAFSNQNNLKSLIIPESVDTLETYSVYNCQNLEYIKLPNSLKNISWGPIQGCEKMKTAGPTAGDYNFEFDWTTKVPDYIFNMCGELESVVLPDTIEYIGASSFGSTAIEEFIFPENLKVIATNAFNNCTNLIEIEVPNREIVLERGAFSHCSNLKKLVIPEKVKVKEAVFGNCPKFVTAGPIGGGYDVEFNWKDTIPYDAFSNCTGLESIVLPSTITEIGDNAFYECTNLKSIKLPHNIERINNLLFYGCKSLTEIEIPVGVTTIEADPFYECRNLTKVTIPKTVTSISSNTFQHCYDLTIYGFTGTVAENYAKVNDIPFVALEDLTFSDVRATDWFYSAVDFVARNGLMTGMNETTFGPAINLSRAQFAVILWRMNGSPVMDYKATFPDVPAGTWYTDAVLWANQKGIITGYSHNGHFGSADNITREQMALMMFRYGNFKGFDVSQRADFGAFKDAASVSGFASEAMKWTVANGIITGKQNGTALEPQGNASRAECATIIMRFMNTYE